MSDELLETFGKAAENTKSLSAGHGKLLSPIFGCVRNAHLPDWSTAANGGAIFFPRKSPEKWPKHLSIAGQGEMIIYMRNKAAYSNAVIVRNG